MTIAAGFRCRDGLLLCADSQFSGADKGHPDKVTSRPFGAVTVAFAMSGDEDYARTAIYDSYEAVADIPLDQCNISTTRKAIRRAITRVNSEYSRQSHLDATQRPEFIIGITETITGLSGLFSSRDSAFPPIEEFDCRGSGSYIANFILRASQARSTATVMETLPMALRAISAAKRHDAYSGGGSQYIVLGGHPGRGAGMQIAAYHNDASDTETEHFERLCGLLYGELCNFGIPDEEFHKRMDWISAQFGGMRKEFVRPGSAYRGVSDSISQVGSRDPESTTGDPQDLPPSQESPGGSGES
jgi:hypothetical protein